MNKIKLKNSLRYALVLILAWLILWIGHIFTTDQTQIFGKSGGAEVYSAKVETIMVDNSTTRTVDNFEYSQTDIHFQAIFTDGPQKGERVIVRQISNSLYTIPVKAVERGDNIMVCLREYEDLGMIWMFQEYNRTIPLLALLLVFFAVMMIFGGKRGMGTICSLVFTCLCIFYFFLPAILAGWNIYYLTLFSCVYIVVTTLILVNGFNYKSLSAGLGSVCGLVVAGILFFVMNQALQLTGVLDEESSYLTMLNPPVDLKAIIFAGALIGVLGGVLDVGVSIASSLQEIYGERTDMSFKDVVRSGMNIGRDILCTMTNTLILAYIGGALSLTLLLIVYSNSFLELMNRETIVVEVLNALLGCIGLLCTIPLTTVFYAFAVTRKKQKHFPNPPPEQEPDSDIPVLKSEQSGLEVSCELDNKA